MNKIKEIIEDTLILFFSIIIAIAYIGIVFVLPAMALIGSINTWEIRLIATVIYEILAMSFTYALMDNC